MGINNRLTLVSWERWNKIQPALLERNRRTLPPATLQNRRATFHFAFTLRSIFILSAADESLCSLTPAAGQTPERAAAFTLCSKTQLRGLTGDKPGRDKHPILSCRPQTVRLSRKMFFLLYIFPVYSAAISVSAIGWLDGEELLAPVIGVIDIHETEEKGSKAFFFFSLHYQTCTGCKDARATLGVKISRPC